MVELEGRSEISNRIARESEVSSHGPVKPIVPARRQKLSQYISKFNQSVDQV
jgi:hypothetical protein